MKKILLTLIGVCFYFVVFAEDPIIKKVSKPYEKDAFTNLYFTATNGVKWKIFLRSDGSRYALRTAKVNGKIKNYIYEISKN